MSLVKVSGNASGTGTLTIAAPNTNSDYTLTLPTNTGTLISTASTGQVIPKAALPTGSVLQVVNATTIAAISTSSTSFVTTGFSVSITPSSSTSKVLLFVNGGGGFSGDINRSIFSTIYRGATNLGDATYGLERMYGNSSSVIAPHSMSVLDSPATTSSTTYTCYFKSSAAANVDFSAADRGIISFTAMEIAA